MGLLKPSRMDALAANEGDEVICDLDVITSKRVTFTFQGKTHALCSITTQVFFEFWENVAKFEKLDHHSSEISNQAFFRMIKTICSTVTLSEVEAMTVVQKATLLKHITAKIIGNKSLFDQAEKKNLKILSQEPTSSAQAT